MRRWREGFTFPEPSKDHRTGDEAHDDTSIPRAERMGSLF